MNRIEVQQMYDRCLADREELVARTLSNGSLTGEEVCQLLVAITVRQEVILRALLSVK